jgi:hypothetical protein
MHGAGQLQGAKIALAKRARIRYNYCAVKNGACERAAENPIRAFVFLCCRAGAKRRAKMKKKIVVKKEAAPKKAKAVITEEVTVECRAQGMARVDELLDLQGNLKQLPSENYKKMSKEMLRYGFIEPVSIWVDPAGKKYILNGHQRVKCIKKMKEDGYKVPVELPVNIVNAKNLKEAKQKLLALASTFGVMDVDHFKEFVEDTGLSKEDMRGMFEFDKEVENYINSDDAAAEENPEAMELDEGASEAGGAGEFGKNWTLVFYFDNKDEYDEVMKIMGTKNKTIAGKTLIDALKGQAEK